MISSDDESHDKADAKPASNSSIQENHMAKELQQASQASLMSENSASETEGGIGVGDYGNEDGQLQVESHLRQNDIEEEQLNGDMSHEEMEKRHVRHVGGAMVLGEPVAVSFEEVVRLGAERPWTLSQDGDDDEQSNPLASSHRTSSSPHGTINKDNIGLPIQREKWYRPDGDAYRLPLVQGNQRRHMMFDVYFSSRSIGLTLSHKEHIFVQALTGVAAYKLGIIAKGDIIVSASCEDRWIRCNETLNELTDFIRDSSRPIVLRFWRRPEPLQLGSVLISNGPLEVFLNFVNRYLDSSNYREVLKNERALEKILREENMEGNIQLVGATTLVSDDIEGDDDADTTTTVTDDEEIESPDVDMRRHAPSSPRKYVNTAVAQIMFLVEVVKIRQRIKAGSHRFNQATVENSIRKGIAAKYLQGKNTDFSIRDVIYRNPAANQARREVLSSGSIEALEVLFEYVQELVRNDTFALFLHEKDVERALEKLGERNGWKLRVFSRLVRQIVPLELILENRKCCAAFLIYLLGLEPTKASAPAASALSIWSTAKFCPTLFKESFVPVARRERVYDEETQDLDFSYLHERLLVLCKDLHRQFVHHALGKMIWEAFNSAAKNDGNEALLDKYMPRLSAILQEAKLPDYLNTHRAVAPLPMHDSTDQQDKYLGGVISHVLLFEAPPGVQDPKIFPAIEGATVPPQIERFFLPHRLGNEHVGVGEEDPNQYPMLFNFVMGNGLYGSSLAFREGSSYTGICITSTSRFLDMHRESLRAVAEQHRSSFEKEGQDLNLLCEPVVSTIKTSLADFKSLHENEYKNDELDLDLLFEIFSYDDIIRLFECCLLERKMLFVSKRFTALTTIAEAMRDLLKPMQWSHVYAPILPRRMLDHLECPTPFIIGIHTDYAFKKDFPFVLDAVVVNLDHGTLQMPSMTARGGDTLAAYDEEETSLGSHLMLPQELRAHLVQDLRRLTQPRYESCDSLFGTPVRASKVPSREICDSFHMVVDKLLEQVVPHCIPLNFDKSDALILFNEHRFLDAVNPTHRTFYAALLRTQAFSTHASSLLQHI